MLKKTEMNKEQIFSSGEEDLRKIEDERRQDEAIIPRSNYLLEYDKNLVVQNVREKSTEKQQIKVQPKNHSRAGNIMQAEDDQVFTTENIQTNMKQITKENDSFYQKFQDRSHLSDFNKDNQLTPNNFINVKMVNHHEFTNLETGPHYNNLNTLNNKTKSVKHQYINSK